MFEIKSLIKLLKNKLRSLVYCKLFIKKMIMMMQRRFKDLKKINKVVTLLVKRFQNKFYLYILIHLIIVVDIMHICIILIVNSCIF